MTKEAVDDYGITTMLPADPAHHTMAYNENMYDHLFLMFFFFYRYAYNKGTTDRTTAGPEGDFVGHEVTLPKLYANQKLGVPVLHYKKFIDAKNTGNIEYLSFDKKVENPLRELGIKHGTDKATEHSYTEIYYHLFKDMRAAKIRILEIGSGDTGASHKMWKEFFPKAEVFCFETFHLDSRLPKDSDTYKQRKAVRNDLEKFGVKTFKGNQLSREDLNNFIKKHGGDFDIIIDDGAHMADAIQVSLGVLFPYVKPGGLYIVEDLISAEDRNRKIEEVNEAMASELGIPHKKEYTPQKVFESFARHRTWLSTQLPNVEKEYLINNISKLKMYEDGQISIPKLNNLAVIWKK